MGIMAAVHRVVSLPYLLRELYKSEISEFNNKIHTCGSWWQPILRKVTMEKKNRLLQK